MLDSLSAGLSMTRTGLPSAHVRANFLLYNILFSQLICRLTGRAPKMEASPLFIAPAIIADSGPGMG